MGIWIMSQDKGKLIKPTNLSVDNYNKIFCIYSTITDRDYRILGLYTTKEKAIKVLDMIQTEILKYYKIDGGALASVNFYVQPFAYEPPKVFQMPQDEEVEI